eukprot:3647317-Pleurochrysis_carterae.AAC.1
MARGERACTRDERGGADERGAMRNHDTIWTVCNGVRERRTACSAKRVSVGAGGSVEGGYDACTRRI